MRCYECKQKIENGSVFCTNCGTKIDKKKEIVYRKRDAIKKLNLNIKHSFIILLITCAILLLILIPSIGDDELDVRDEDVMGLFVLFSTGIGLLISFHNWFIFREQIKEKKELFWPLILTVITFFIIGIIIAYGGQNTNSRYDDENTGWLIVFFWVVLIIWNGFLQFNLHKKIFVLNRIGSILVSLYSIIQLIGSLGGLLLSFGINSIFEDDLMANLIFPIWICFAVLIIHFCHLAIYKKNIKNNNLNIVS